jgi:hypothetical protein
MGNKGAYIRLTAPELKPDIKTFSAVVRPPPCILGVLEIQFFPLFDANEFLDPTLSPSCH